MDILELIFVDLLFVAAVVACFRIGKLMVRVINKVFDKIGDWIG